MTALSLTLTRSGRQQRQPAATLLPGQDPSGWVAQLTAHSGMLGTLELFRLPKASGLFVVWLAESADHPGRGLRFGRLGQHLFLPVDAVVQPPISSEEADRLFGRWKFVVWHPALGPLGFDREDAVPLVDLLALPRSRPSATWNDAQAGPAPLPPMRGIQFVLPVQRDDLFGDAPREIGHEPALPDASNLAPRQGEPREGAAGEMMRRAKLATLRALGGLMRGIQQTGSQRTWVNDFEDWLGQRFERVRGELDDLRHRAIDRLLQELKENPDLGLRHAIPLGSLPGDAPRGIAPPGSQLGLRNPDFNLGGLFAGRPADGWALDAMRQQHLRQLYHELANRELQLGRFRRAAYIFAELLRDLHSAANALVQGRFYREAAALYLDHLQNPVLAARTLEKGGHLEEALPIYESRQDWRPVARIHRALGNEESARSALRREVDRLLGLEDRIGAATTLELELNAPREAAEILAAGWPDSAAAASCLRELFALHGRQIWPEATHKLLAQLRDCRLPAPQAVLLGQTLVAVQGLQPTPALGALVADAARVCVGRHLPGAEPEIRRALAETLARLAPEDRLLGRDVHRFLATAPAVPPPVFVPASPPSGKRRGRIEFLGSIQSEPRLKHAAATGSTRGYAVAGRGPNGGLWMRISDWAGVVQSAKWPAGPSAEGELILVAEWEKTIRVVVARAGGDRPDEWRLREGAFKNAFGQPGVSAGTPEWWPRDAVAATYQESSLLVLRCEIQPERNEVIIAQYAGRELVGTVPVPVVAPLHDGHYALAAHAKGAIAIGVGHVLLLMSSLDASEPTALQLDHPVVSILATAKHARAGFVVTTTCDVDLYWFDELEAVPVAESRRGGIRAGLTAGGNVVVVDDEGGRVYEIGRTRAPEIVADFWALAASGITPAGTRDEFAVFYRDGSVARYRVSP